MLGLIRSLSLFFLFVTAANLTSFASENSYQSPLEANPRPNDTVHINLIDSHQSERSGSWFYSSNMPLAQPYPYVTLEAKSKKVTINQLADILESLLTEGYLSRYYTLEFQRSALFAMVNWSNYFITSDFWDKSDRPANERIKHLLRNYTNYHKLAQDFSQYLKSADYELEEEGRRNLNKIMIQMALFDAIQSKAQSKYSRLSATEKPNLTEELYKKRMADSSKTLKVVDQLGETLAEWMIWRYAWITPHLWQGDRASDTINELQQVRYLTQLFSAFEKRLQTHLPEAYREVSEVVITKVTSDKPLKFNPYLQDSTWRRYGDGAIFLGGASGLLTIIGLNVMAHHWVQPVLKHLLSPNAYEMIVDPVRSVPVMLIGISASIYVGYRAAKSVVHWVESTHAKNRIASTTSEIGLRQSSLVDPTRVDWTTNSMIVRLQNRCVKGVGQ